MDSQTCTSKSGTVIGVFESDAHARDAVRDLKSMGFTDQEIGVVARNQAGDSVADAADDNESGKMGAVGAATGAGVGALWALGIAAGALPAIGPAIAGGILGSLLSSAAAGAAVVGLAGMLTELGVSKDEAEYYEGEFKAGRTIVTVKAGSRADEACSLLKRHGAYDLQTKDTYQASEEYRSKVTSSPVASFPTLKSVSVNEASTGKDTVRLHEEKVGVQKQQKQTGEVRVHKEIVTEHKTIEVPVTREEVVIERRPASGSTTKGSLNPGEEIRIPVKEEQVDVSKRVVAKEDVKIGKRTVTENKSVDADVAREEVRVEEVGKVKVDRK